MILERGTAQGMNFELEILESRMYRSLNIMVLCKKRRRSDEYIRMRI